MLLIKKRSSHYLKLKTLGYKCKLLNAYSGSAWMPYSYSKGIVYDHHVIEHFFKFKLYFAILRYTIVSKFVLLSAQLMNLQNVSDCSKTGCKLNLACLPWSSQDQYLAAEVCPSITSGSRSSRTEFEVVEARNCTSN